MQTILGAGGIIANELAKALTSYTDNIKLVSRNPVKVNDSDIVFAADLTQPSQVLKAVEGSEVVYLTAGLAYDTNVWKKTWPVIMQNVIDACVSSHSRLVFFDNIYLYGSNDLDPISEHSLVDPPSEKGKVRAAIIKMLWKAVEEKGLVALVARSADFYGPGINNVSMLTETVIKPLSQGKTANWMGSDKYKHSFTYTPDAGKATALLGNTLSAYGQTWHLPTAGNPLTGKAWVEAFAAALNRKPKHRNVGKPMVKIMGWFMPIMREMYEMLYQYDRDYVFNSDKFEQAFSFTPTPYQQGIAAIVAADYK